MRHNYSAGFLSFLMVASACGHQSPHRDNNDTTVAPKLDGLALDLSTEFAGSETFPMAKARDLVPDLASSPAVPWAQVVCTGDAKISEQKVLAVIALVAYRDADVVGEKIVLPYACASASRLVFPGLLVGKRYRLTASIVSLDRHNGYGGSTKDFVLGKDAAELVMTQQGDDSATVKITFAKKPVKKPENITSQAPVAADIKVDLDECNQGAHFSKGFAMGSLEVEILSKKVSGECIIRYAVVVEDPRWDGFLDHECLFVAGTHSVTFPYDTAKDGFDLTSFAPFCRVLKRK